MRNDAVLRVLVVVALILVLEALCRIGTIPASVFLAPSAMVLAMVGVISTGEFTSAIVLTLSNVVAAVAISIALGTTLGAVIHTLPRLRRALDPFFASYYAVPSFLFYPVLILFLGVGRTSIITLAVMMGAVAIIVATLAGLDGVPGVLMRTARVLHMSRLRTAFSIQMPSAAPYLFSGIKLAVAYGFIGVLASEFILSGSGLGYNIADAYNQFDNRTMYGLMLFVILVVMLINAVLHVMDQRLQARRRR
jgi:NitT/TauT family transport system permease protein